MPDPLTRSILRLGTRGSLLARAQSQLVAQDLMRRSPGLQVEILTFKTTGDQIVDRPLHELGGKGLFTRELEIALLNRQIDFAVHSLKDVPVTMPLVPQEDLLLAAIPRREDPRDALVATKYRRIEDLPPSARVGTGSLRRRCQLLAIRSDLRVEPLRGNLDTRLRRMREGSFDAIILAMAGLLRSGLFLPTEATPLELAQMIPAAGQGALALQCRRDAHDVQQILQLLHDDASATCIEAERAVVAALHGDCHSPIAALARINGDQLQLLAAVGASGGDLPVVSAMGASRASEARALVEQVVADLHRQGATELLSGKPIAGDGF